MLPDATFQDTVNSGADGTAPNPTQPVKPSATDPIGSAGWPLAYDTTYTEDQWQNDENLKLTFPKIEPVVQTCWDECREKDKLASKKCAIARKRVEEGLKQAGCPSRVTALARKSPCAKKSSKAKSTKRR